MLFFLFTCCFSFLFFYKSLVLKPLPIWASEFRLLSLWFLKDFSFIPIIKGLFSVTYSLLTSIMSPKMKNHKSKVDFNETKSSEMSILDLPDLAIECILEKLPPEGLCKMASVCTSLRDKCVSDHLWEKHMKNKWSPIVGPAASREWQWFLASGKGSVLFNQGKQSGSLFGYLVRLWPFRNLSKKSCNFFPVDSVRTCYLALESGKFWFPAQVYNRENGHVGFLLSCYDAELCYDQSTDSFQARYPPHGRRASTVESGVTWDRLRAPPVDTSPHNLHISDCLNELHPGDHVEIQWRRNKEFPYGWWYGAVGHLETCDGNANYCQCHKSDTLVLEFNQYAHGSRWRTTTVDRKYHREEGNELDGFYGGIRKVCNKDEICAWRKLWPTETLE